MEAGVNMDTGESKLRPWTWGQGRGDGVSG